MVVEFRVGEVTVVQDDIVLNAVNLDVFQDFFVRTCFRGNLFVKFFF